MCKLFYMLSAMATITAPTLDAPVHEWREPGLQVSVARSALVVRGHVASQRHADRLLTGTQDAQTEFWRHVILPDFWRDLSVELLGISRLLQSGEATLSRDGVWLKGLVTDRETISQPLERLELLLPTGMTLHADVRQLEKPADVCAAIKDTLETDALLFARNSDVIRGAYTARLNQIADFLRRCDDYQLTATGHADGVGSIRGSRRVSERRASAITDYLESLGVPRERLSSVGKGQSAPIASNATWEGRNLNRRVTVTLYSVAASSAGP